MEVPCQSLLTVIILDENLHFHGGFSTVMLHTRSLNQKHIPKRGQVIKIVLISVFRNVSILNAR